MARTTFANLSDGLQSLALFDSNFADCATLSGTNIFTIPTGNSRGIVVNQSYSGSTLFPQGIVGIPVRGPNGIFISSDTMQASPGFVSDFNVVHLFGGGSGGREGLFSWVKQTAAQTAGSRNYVGVVGIGSTISGDGGTGLTLANTLGAYFGGNFQTRLGPLATNVFSSSTVEIDTWNAAGSSVWYNWGLGFANSCAVQGAGLDAALVIYSTGSQTSESITYGPGLGFHQGLCFAETSGSGLPPVDSGATLIGTHLETLSSFSAANGVDFRKFNFSGLAYTSPGFSVNGSGVVAACSGTAIPAGGTTGTGITVSSTSNFGVFFGSGLPSLVAAKGSLYLRSDGLSSGTRLYIAVDSAGSWTNVLCAT